MTEYDSAGITIVDVAGTPVPSGAFELEGIFEHGLEPGDYQFQSVFTGALQPDGSAVVADQGNDEVLVVSADGTSFDLIASPGRGPSEVLQVGSVHVLGQDSVWIEDDGNGKIMLLVEGTPVRSIPTSQDVDLLRLTVMGPAPEGGLFMETGAYSMGFEEEWLPGHFMRYDIGSGARDTIGAYEMVRKAPPSDWNPFPSSGRSALSSGEFVSARADVAQLLWRRPTGEPRLIFRWRPTRVFPTEEHWEEFRASARPELRRMNPGATAPDIDRLVDNQLARYTLHSDVPLPLFGTMHGDDAGRVWLGEYIPSRADSPARYDVVSPSGEWLGEVVFPHGLRILDIQGDRVLGAFKDEMDVTGVAVYRVRYVGG